jgi:hypothetical protein
MVDALRLDCWVENAEDEDCDGRSLFFGPTNDGSVIIRDPFGLARNPPRLITVHHQNAKNSAQNTSEPLTKFSAIKWFHVGMQGGMSWQQ